MTTLIKLFYAGAIAALLVLLVAFGIRTFYVAPEEPQFPQTPPNLFRQPAALATPSPDGQPAPTPTLTPEQGQYEQDQEQYRRDYEAYEDERADYRRNVFLISSLFGVLAIAAGLYLNEKVDAIRLGLVAGGLGTILYAVVQAGGDLDDAGSAVVFAVALLGFALILGAGYRWLGRNEG